MSYNLGYTRFLNLAHFSFHLQVVLHIYTEISFQSFQTQAHVENRASSDRFEVFYKKCLSDEILYFL